jgi:hypothetical protein
VNMSVTTDASYLALVSISSGESFDDADGSYTLVPSDPGSIDMYWSLQAPMEDWRPGSNGPLTWTSPTGNKVRSTDDGFDIASLTHPRTSDVWLSIQASQFESGRFGGSTGMGEEDAHEQA